ncbi:MAG TPA: tetratricopeptide repeat protein [Ktedonobacterales bacterium]
MLADYRALAHLFQLPEHSSTQQAVVKAAVKRWLHSYTEWLLIFDNVEDLELLQSMLPEASQGHILITTRSPVGGKLGAPLAVPMLDEEESALLLLRRAKLLTPETPLEAAPRVLQTEALTLVHLFDGYPLALDQAGAYTDETSCRLADYLELYTTRRSALLDSRGAATSDHPASVTATLSLAFAQVEQASPAAAELLKLCAFLHADTIPKTLLTRAGDTLGPTLHALACDPLLLDRAIKELRHFSLVQRDPDTHTLRLHRLVQLLLSERMEPEERKGWIERLIRALLRIFPSHQEAAQVADQKGWQPYLSHALVCVAALHEVGITSPEAAELLNRVGYHSYFWGDTTQAIQLLEQGLALALKIPEIGHEAIVFYCTMLGEVYMAVKEYRRAEALFRQALERCEQLLGPEHSQIAELLWPFASLLWRLGHYPQAESLAQRALALQEHHLGGDHYKVGLILTILGAVALYQDQYQKAERLFLRVIHLYEQTFGSEHFYLSSVKKQLADLYMRQALYPQAVALYQHVLQIAEQHFGPAHIQIAATVLDLGRSHFAMQHYSLAEPLCRRACQICEKTTDPDPLRLTISLLHFGALSLVQGRQRSASSCLRRAHRLLGESISSRHLDQEEIIRCLLLAGDRFIAQEERMQAQRQYHETVTVGVALLGPEHPLVADCRSRLATLGRETASELSQPKASDEAAGGLPESALFKS